MKTLPIFMQVIGIVIIGMPVMFLSTVLPDKWTDYLINLILNEHD